MNAGRPETYTYKANHWLESATGSWGSLTFSMDNTGNRTQEVYDDTSTVTTKNYATTSTDNLLDTVTQGATTLRSFTYDGAGNVTADTRGATAYNYRYNKRGRMDRLTIGSTATADYTFDGLERMAIRTTQNMVPAASHALRLRPLTPSQATHVGFLYRSPSRVVLAASPPSASRQGW